MSAKTYLVEAYVSKSDANGPAGIRDRAVLASKEMRREGTFVRYLRSIFVPQDETCFHIFEAGSEQDARNAAARAGIQPEGCSRRPISKQDERNAHDQPGESAMH